MSAVPVVCQPQPTGSQASPTNDKQFADTADLPRANRTLTSERLTNAKPGTWQAYRCKTAMTPKVLPQIAEPKKMCL